MELEGLEALQGKQGFGPALDAQIRSTVNKVMILTNLKTDQGKARNGREVLVIGRVKQRRSAFDNRVRCQLVDGCQQELFRQYF